MAMQTVNVHLFMESRLPMHPNGYSDYSKEKSWEPDIWSVRVDDNDERIYVGPRQIEIDVPDDFNPIPQQVAALEREKAEALAKYQASVAQINERLSKLLAITHEA